MIVKEEIGIGIEIEIESRRKEEIDLVLAPIQEDAQRVQDLQSKEEEEVRTEFHFSIFYSQGITRTSEERRAMIAMWNQEGDGGNNGNNQ